jgi:hypothetical protein
MKLSRRPLLLINLSETNSPIRFCRAASTGPTHAQEARPLFRHNQGSGFHLLGSGWSPEGLMGPGIRELPQGGVTTLLNPI